jgi:hypothetical protein
VSFLCLWEQINGVRAVNPLDACRMVEELPIPARHQLDEFFVVTREADCESDRVVHFDPSGRRSIMFP